MRLPCRLQQLLFGLIAQLTVLGRIATSVKVLSYFIETDVTSIKLNELVEAFRTMYGKSATFIDPKNVHQVTKTLNNLFLKRDLVS